MQNYTLDNDHTILIYEEFFSNFVAQPHFMNQLHIFNPSHDEALAANSPYYYPARAARTLATDLAALPVYWAESGDWVLLPDDKEIPLLGEDYKDIHFVRWNEIKTIDHSAIAKICPWGWDALLVHQLRKAGIPEGLLPDAAALSHMRNLSSRQTAVKLLNAIRKDFPDTTGESFWCTDESEIWEIAGKYGDVMLKAPWSSSGRGVFAANSKAPINIRQRVEKILKEQGAVEVEPLYPRIQDFALEFFAYPEGVKYKGLSVFATSDSGAYTGNVVGEEALLSQHLPNAIIRQLPDVTQQLCKHLHTLLAGHYEGPLGIDMMVVHKAGNDFALHPCVEINLRNTMGHVALALKRLVAKEQTAIYSIHPIALQAQDTLLLTPHAQKMEATLSFKS